MPKGRRGEKRPAYVIGAAGEEQDGRKATVSATAQVGELRGAARAKTTTLKRRQEIEKEAAAKC